MIYVGLNKKPIKPGFSLVTCRRNITFILTDRARFDTKDFLKILWRLSGGVIETVTLHSTYHNPETGALSHSYSLTFRCCNHTKVGFGLPATHLNNLMADIEDEIEQTLHVIVPSHHRRTTLKPI